MKGRPKIDPEIRAAEQKLAEMERGLLAAYELTEMGRKKVEAQRARVAELKSRQTE